MEHFIETVHKYPCLWNTTAIEYRDQELKDAAWAEVMKETDLSSGDVKGVKLKWKKLRDSYRDALKRQTDMQAKGTSAGKKSYPWKYMAHMQFLQPHMSVRRKPADAPAPAGLPPHNGDASSSASDDEPRPKRGRQPPAEPPPSVAVPADLPLQNGDASSSASDDEPRPKRARHPLNGPTGPVVAPAAPPALLDPLDIFFSGMCQTTKRLPYPVQIRIKRALFAAVVEAEEALVAEQQQYAGLWARGPASSDDDDDDDRKPS